ncbi:MAG: PAS domain S-box protein, partial [Smithella sp.]
METLVNPERMTKKDLMILVKSLRERLEGTESSALLGDSGEYLYKILAQSSQVGFYIMQDGRFKFINSHMRDYTGYSEDEMLKMNPTLFILPED